MLSEWRKRQRLTLAALAAHAGVTPAAICQWESGARQPSAGLIEAYAAALGVPVGDVRAAAAELWEARHGRAKTGRGPGRGLK